MKPDLGPQQFSEHRDLRCEIRDAHTIKPVHHLEILRLIAESAALKAGNVLKDLGGRFKPSVKADAFVGARAIVTDADLESQKALISVFQCLLETDSEYGFITEEHVRDASFKSHIIGADQLHLLKDKTIFIIDELDGTWKHKSNHHDWSVSIGCFAKLAHVAGVVYAPKIDGGSLYSAVLGSGTTLKTPMSEAQMHVSSATELKHAAIGFGVDCAISDKFLLQANLFRTVGNSAGQSDLCGSCALGLALVAAGKLDALVQPPQRVWDWAGGKLLVEEAGGQVILYRQNGVQVERVNAALSLECDVFNPEKRSVGLIAGPEGICEQLFELLEAESTSLQG